MVFSSVPVYLDPPNWQQQQPNQQPGGSSSDNHQLSLPPPPTGGGGGGTGSIRPCSMADRARLAKLPQPETALKCPRCESTNTKFCYFNNYSLSQPRHFCKTCRRYWTRGGALRSVPVGGGCRRNKRSKGRRSKSPMSAERPAGSNSTSEVPSNSCSTTTADILSHLPPPVAQQLPFLPPLHHLTDYGSGNIGLNFGGLQPMAATGGSSSHADMEIFHIGSSSASGGGGGGTMLSSGIGEQWRIPPQVQQFPFLAGLEPPAGLYPFEGEGVEPQPGYMGGGSGQLRAKPPLDSGFVTRLQPAVKMEENQGLNLSRNFLGVLGNDQYWGGGGNNAWTDLSGFTSSSSTSHFL